MENIYHSHLNDSPDSDEAHSELHRPLKDETFNTNINSIVSQSHLNEEKLLLPKSAKDIKDLQSIGLNKPYTLDQIEHIYKSFRNN